eukprot:11574175-Alexandrium_andersonii.AAC.1
MTTQYFRTCPSNPATVDAAKAADLVSLFPGNRGAHADAAQAYTQAKLGDTPTWVRPPEAPMAAGVDRCRNDRPG